LCRRGRKLPPHGAVDIWHKVLKDV